MSTSIVINPDETIMVGTNGADADNSRVEDTHIIVEHVYVPYGLLLCMLIDLIVCIYILTYHKYYINFAILFLVINITLYGIRTINIWAIKLYCAYHLMSIIFLGLYTYVIHAIVYSLYHISCIYCSIKCIMKFKMILSNNVVSSV